MQHQVTQRFIECFQELKKMGAIRSARQFALSVDFHPQSLHEILKGRREVTIDLISRATERYALNCNYLLSGTGSHFASALNEPTQTTETPLLHIPYIQWSDRKIYTAGSRIDSIEREWPLLAIPPQTQLSGEDLKAFEFRGRAFEPCLTDADILISRSLDKVSWTESLKEGSIYIFVTKDKVHYSRFLDWIIDDKEILLSSSNFDQADRVLIDMEEIFEIWEILTRITARVPSATSPEHRTEKSISELSDALKKQGEVIHSLNLTVEKLLKQNRSLRV